MGVQMIQTRDGVPVGRLAWRFFTGAHMNGVRRSDAGWTRRGAVCLDGRAAGSWERLSRVERAGVRLGSSSVLTALAAAYASAPETTTMVAGTSALTLACGAGATAAWWTADAALTFRHRREWVEPLHTVLSGLLALPPGTSAASYLKVSTGFSERDGEIVRVSLPLGFAGDEGTKSLITSAIKARLGLREVSFAWKLAGRRPHLIVTSAPRPPAKSLFSDPAVRALVETAPESAPVIGLTARGQVVAVDLDAESPHVLVSMSTGGGKSVVLRTVFAQLLHKGAEGIVLDRKRHSHKWSRGISGVRYCREIAEIHDGLVALGVEGERRNRIVDDWEGDDRDAPVGPRRVILLEEANATIGKLKRYWTEIKTKDDPKESPAITALSDVLFMGRAVKMNVLLVAQSATAAALGGPEMRENFATRILARYTQNAWRMLVPEVSPIPRSTRHVGRAQVVMGSVAHETQVLFFTDAEARSWATEGRAAVSSQRPVTTVDLQKDPVTVPATAAAGEVEQPESGEGRRLHLVGQQDRPAAHPQPESERPVSLSQAVAAGVLKCSLAVARKNAAGRDPEFPKPVAWEGSAKLYRKDDLICWERNRPRAANAS